MSGQSMHKTILRKSKQDRKRRDREKDDDSTQFDSIYKVPEKVVLDIVPRRYTADENYKAYTIFSAIDIDGNGRISAREFHRLLRGDLYITVVVTFHHIDTGILWGLDEDNCVCVLDIDPKSPLLAQDSDVVRGLRLVRINGHQVLPSGGSDALELLEAYLVDLDPHQQIEMEFIEPTLIVRPLGNFLDIELSRRVGGGKFSIALPTGAVYNLSAFEAAVAVLFAHADPLLANIEFSVDAQRRQVHLISEKFSFRLLFASGKNKDRSCKYTFGFVDEDTTFRHHAQGLEMLMDLNLGITRNELGILMAEMLERFDKSSSGSFDFEAFRDIYIQYLYDDEGRALLRRYAQYKFRDLERQNYCHALIEQQRIRVERIKANRVKAAPTAELKRKQRLESSIVCSDDVMRRVKKSNLPLLKNVLEKRHHQQRRGGSGAGEQDQTWVNPRSRMIETTVAVGTSEVGGPVKSEEVVPVSFSRFPKAFARVDLFEDETHRPKIGAGLRTDLHDRKLTQRIYDSYHRLFVQKNRDDFHAVVPPRGEGSRKEDVMREAEDTADGGETAGGEEERGYEEEHSGGVIVKSYRQPLDIKDMTRRRIGVKEEHNRQKLEKMRELMQRVVRESGNSALVGAAAAGNRIARASRTEKPELGISLREIIRSAAKEAVYVGGKNANGALEYSLSLGRLIATPALTLTAGMFSDHPTVEDIHLVSTSSSKMHPATTSYLMDRDLSSGRVKATGIAGTANLPAGAAPGFDCQVLHPAFFTAEYYRLPARQLGIAMGAIRLIAKPREEAEKYRIEHGIILAPEVYAEISGRASKQHHIPDKGIEGRVEPVGEIAAWATIRKLSFRNLPKMHVLLPNAPFAHIECGDYKGKFRLKRESKSNDSVEVWQLIPKDSFFPVRKHVGGVFELHAYSGRRKARFKYIGCFFVSTDDIANAKADNITGCIQVIGKLGTEGTGSFRGDISITFAVEYGPTRIQRVPHDDSKARRIEAFRTHMERKAWKRQARRLQAEERASAMTLPLRMEAPVSVVEFPFEIEIYSITLSDMPSMHFISKNSPYVHIKCLDEVCIEGSKGGKHLITRRVVFSRETSVLTSAGQYARWGGGYFHYLGVIQSAQPQAGVIPTPGQSDSAPVVEHHLWRVPIAQPSSRLIITVHSIDASCTIGSLTISGYDLFQLPRSKRSLRFQLSSQLMRSKVFPSFSRSGSGGGSILVKCRVVSDASHSMYTSHSNSDGMGSSQESSEAELGLSDITLDEFRQRGKASHSDGVGGNNRKKFSHRDQACGKLGKSTKNDNINTVELDSPGDTHTTKIEMSVQAAKHEKEAAAEAGGEHSKELAEKAQLIRTSRKFAKYRSRVTESSPQESKEASFSCDTGEELTSSAQPSLLPVTLQDPFDKLLQLMLTRGHTTRLAASIPSPRSIYFSVSDLKVYDVQRAHLVGTNNLLVRLTCEGFVRVTESKEQVGSSVFWCDAALDFKMTRIGFVTLSVSSKRVPLGFVVLDTRDILGSPRDESGVFTVVRQLQRYEPRHGVLQSAGIILLRVSILPQDESENAGAHEIRTDETTRLFSSSLSFSGSARSAPTARVTLATLNLRQFAVPASPSFLVTICTVRAYAMRDTSNKGSALRTLRLECGLWKMQTKTKVVPPGREADWTADLGPPDGRVFSCKRNTPFRFVVLSGPAVVGMGAVTGAAFVDEADALIAAGVAETTTGVPFPLKSGHSPIDMHSPLHSPLLREGGSLDEHSHVTTVSGLENSTTLFSSIGSSCASPAAAADLNNRIYTFPLLFPLFKNGVASGRIAMTVTVDQRDQSLLRAPEKDDTSMWDRYLLDDDDEEGDDGEGGDEEKDAFDADGIIKPQNKFLPVTEASKYAVYHASSSSVKASAQLLPALEPTPPRPTTRLVREVASRAADVAEAEDPLPSWLAVPDSSPPAQSRLLLLPVYEEGGGVGAQQAVPAGVQQEQLIGQQERERFHFALRPKTSRSRADAVSELQQCLAEISEDEAEAFMTALVTQSMRWARRILVGQQTKEASERDKKFSAFSEQLKQALGTVDSAVIHSVAQESVSAILSTAIAAVLSEALLESFYDGVVRADDMQTWNAENSSAAKTHTESEEEEKSDGSSDRGRLLATSYRSRSFSSLESDRLWKRRNAVIMSYVHDLPFRKRNLETMQTARNPGHPTDTFDFAKYFNRSSVPIDETQHTGTRDENLHGEELGSFPSPLFSSASPSAVGLTAKGAAASSSQPMIVHLNILEILNVDITAIVPFMSCPLLRPFITVRKGVADPSNSNETGKVRLCTSYTWAAKSGVIKGRSKMKRPRRSRAAMSSNSLMSDFSEGDDSRFLESAAASATQGEPSSHSKSRASLFAPVSLLSWYNLVGEIHEEETNRPAVSKIKKMIGHESTAWRRGCSFQAGEFLEIEIHDDVNGLLFARARLHFDQVVAFSRYASPSFRLGELGAANDARREGPYAAMVPLHFEVMSGSFLDENEGADSGSVVHAFGHTVPVERNQLSAALPGNDGLRLGSALEDITGSPDRPDTRSNQIHSPGVVHKSAHFSDDAAIFHITGDKDGEPVPLTPSMTISRSPEGETRGSSRHRIVGQFRILLEPKLFSDDLKKFQLIDEVVKPASLYNERHLPHHWKIFPLPPISVGVLGSRFPGLTHDYDKQRVLHPCFYGFAARWKCTGEEAKHNAMFTNPIFGGYNFSRPPGPPVDARIAAVTHLVESKVKKGKGKSNVYKWDPKVSLIGGCKVCGNGVPGCPRCFSLPVVTPGKRSFPEDFGFDYSKEQRMTEDREEGVSKAKANRDVRAPLASSSLQSKEAKFDTKDQKKMNKPFLHTNLVTHSSIRYARSFRSYFHIYIKAMPSGAIRQITVEPETTVFYLHYMAVSHLSCGLTSGGLLVLPTTVGLFEATHTVQGKDEYNNPDDSGNYQLAEYKLTQKDSNIVFIFFPKYRRASASQFVASYLHNNSDYELDRDTPVYTTLDRIPEKVWEDEVQKELLTIVQRQYTIQEYQLKLSFDRLAEDVRGHLASQAGGLLKTKKKAQSIL